jgi:hypothetical protein
MCELWVNEKKQKTGAGYFEQFIVWDKDWNIVKISEPFKFAEFGIEFTNGLAYKDGTFYIPFALQDNFSFMIAVDEKIVSDFIFNNKKEFGNYYLDKGSEMLRFFDNPSDSYRCLEFGNTYYNNNDYAPAMVLYERACEYNTFKTQNELYNAMYLCGKAIACHGKNDDAEILLWNKMIDLDMNRSEGYLMASKYYIWRNRFSEAYTFAKLAYELNNYKMVLPEAMGGLYIGEFDGEMQYIWAMYNTEKYLDCLPMAYNLKQRYGNDEYKLAQINAFIKLAEDNKKNRQRVL